MDTLDQGHFYHIFNRGNNKQKIFLEHENYPYFLQLMKRHLSPKINIFAYCLLPYHFHLLVEIDEIAKKPSQAFSNLFNSYTKSFNKKYKHTGSLFQRPFKRVMITDEMYLKKLLIYIHRNPENHGLIADFRDYGYSSYNSLISEKDTALQRNEVLDWFEGKENFCFEHGKSSDLLESSGLNLE